MSCRQRIGRRVASAGRADKERRATGTKRQAADAGERAVLTVAIFQEPGTRRRHQGRIETRPHAKHTQQNESAHVSPPGYRLSVPFAALPPGTAALQERAPQCLQDSTDSTNGPWKLDRLSRLARAEPGQCRRRNVCDCRSGVARYCAASDASKRLGLQVETSIAVRPSNTYWASNSPAPGL